MTMIDGLYRYDYGIEVRLITLESIPTGVKANSPCIIGIKHVQIPIFKITQKTFPNINLQFIQTTILNPAKAG
jgi:hypothetical protein